MKALHSLLLASLLSAPLVPSALAGGPTEMAGSVGSLTFALTFSYSAPNTFQRDASGVIIIPKMPTFENDWSKKGAAITESFHEIASRIDVRKYGNKEFLLDLIDAEILPEIGPAPHVAGWTIVQVTPTASFANGTSNDDNALTFAVHKDETRIDITEVLDINELSWSEKWAFKHTEKEPAGAPITNTVTDALSWKSTLQVSVFFDVEPAFSFQGIFTGSQKQVIIGTGENKRIVQLFGPQKIANISGVGPVIDVVNDDASTIDGTLTIGAGKAVADLSPYDIILK